MSNPKVLIWDIETSPIIGYTWGIWQQDVIQVKEDWQILCIAWKWLGEKTVQVIGQDDFPDYKPGVNNDFMVVCKIRQLLDEADVVVAHNGMSFDTKKAQARIIAHDLAPPSPFKQVDTKREAKKYGAFTSNRLGSLAKELQVSQKGSPGGFETWLGCMSGDKKAWAKMKKYNKQDIPPLEGIYMKLRPWMTTHPSLNVINGKEDACPRCQVIGKMQRRGYTIPTKTGRRRRFQCTGCGGWSQGRNTIKSDILYTT